MTISDYCVKIESLSDALTLAGYCVKDKKLIMHFLAGLPA